MPGITLKNITKKFGDATAVDNLNLDIKDKDFITLLGPSGCGKTTTLRMIAGLETPTEGEIYIGDELVFSSEKAIDLSAANRKVGFVFQNYALWPHMTVYKNIVFGLENEKWNRKLIEERVRDLSRLLKIEDYLDRYPTELSGGQQQRVAIARTLAPNPKVLFMDEPLSNLDAKLRMEMRSELKRIHQETETTFVYVTHDQLEAMSLSTKICIFNNGKLQQYAPPLEIYNSPSNRFVADFVGNPTINFIDVECKESEDSSIEMTFNNYKLKYSPKREITIDKKSSYVLGIRPEHIALSNEGNLAGSIYSSLPTGLETIHNIVLGDEVITAISFGGGNFEIDEKVKFNFISDKIILFDKKSGNLLTHGHVEVL